ncbi:adenosine receptor A2a isoform X2 [Wyeomyia smithii]|nr:adenosine receptor A2a isoform X2 [Wyeomyia smithii]
MAVVGNAMVIVVFKRERRLRRRTNFYIISLAAADFLVGLLGVPFAVLSSVGLPRNLYACLFTISLLIVLCTISIFCLVAVSVDRYWAILHPMAYSRNVRTKTAIVIISLCWLAGSIIGFLPLFGWHETPQTDTCLFLKVMDYDYLVFLYFATIITPALIMLAFYTHIYRVIINQLRQIVTMNPMGTLSSESRSSSESSRIRISTMKSPRCKPGHSHGGTMLRVLGAAQKREVKATQNLSIIVLFFMICWIPLYTINCIVAFCRDCQIPPTLMLFCIILSHLNSAVNPLLYAYHLKDFRAALRNLILSMIGYDVSNQELNYRASLASQFGQRHSVMERRLSPQPKIYVDSPVYLRSMQQQRHQQMILMQQRSLECAESGTSFDILHKKRLVSNTHSDPGSPNILISTSAINASPDDSNCSTPQHYEMGLFDKTYFKMWGIAEVSSVNEITNICNSLDDDNAGDHNEMIIVYTKPNENPVQCHESVERQLSEDHTIKLDSRSETIEDQANEMPDFGLRMADDDCNHSSLYNFVLSKRRSQSTCCILQERDSGASINDPVFLIENASPQRILTYHVPQPVTTNAIKCANFSSNLNLVDSYNNNSQYCNTTASSPNFCSIATRAAIVDKHQRPISKSFSLFNNTQPNQHNSDQKSLSPISNTDSVYTSHSSLFNPFNSSSAKQRICSFKLNKRSLSNDK